MTNSRFILLVEDNVKDEALTLRALKKGNVVTPVVVVRDGAEALDYLFTRGKHSGRDPLAMPQLILLDLKLPKIDGLDVLKALRADERTKLLPVVVLTSSLEDQISCSATAWEPTATSESRSTSPSSPKRCGSSVCIGWS